MSDPQTLARRMFAAIARADEPAIKEICTADVVHVEVGQTHRGSDAVAAHFRPFARAFPDLEIAVGRQACDGDVVFTEMRFIGTQTGPLATPQGEVPPSGRRVDLPGCVIHTIREGRIARHDGYYDQLAFLAQLGLMPSPAAAS